MTRIAVASDHGGFSYKERIAGWLAERGYEVIDCGTRSSESCDYPQYAREAAEMVSRGEAATAVVVCGSGVGVSIVANKSAGVRAANCTSVEMARLAREHNDANVLAIGERLVDWPTAAAIVEAFFDTSASEESRHRRRVDMIHSLTGR
jgi:ribose 5-phosphate isomerase B